MLLLVLTFTLSVKDSGTWKQIGGYGAIALLALEVLILLGTMTWQLAAIECIANPRWPAMWRQAHHTSGVVGSHQVLILATRDNN